VNKNEPARNTKEMLVAEREREAFAKISLFLKYGDYSNSPFVVKMHAKQGEAALSVLQVGAQLIMCLLKTQKPRSRLRLPQSTLHKLIVGCAPRTLLLLHSRHIGRHGNNKIMQRERRHLNSLAPSHSRGQLLQRPNIALTSLKTSSP